MMRGSMQGGLRVLMLWAAACVVAAGCKPQDRPDPTISCDEYDADETVVFNFGDWFGFGDDTPKAYDGTEGEETEEGSDAEEGVMQAMVSRPPNPESVDLVPPLCGLLRGEKFKSYGFNDWGSAWGKPVKPRDMPADGSQYQGIAFWARSAPHADKSFTFVLDTRQTAKPSDVKTGDAGTVIDDPRDCNSPAVIEGAASFRNLSDGTQQITSEVAAADDCGNSFRAVVTMSDRWEYYRIPFEDFWQEALPNRDPHGINASQILGATLRAGKETWLEFEMAGLVFYRKKGWEPEGDFEKALPEETESASAGEAAPTDSDDGSTGTEAEPPAVETLDAGITDAGVRADASVSRKP